jgi:flagellar biosynthetic protein FliO
MSEFVESAQSATPSVVDGVSVLPALAQVGATLLFIIALIFASAWCIKRFNLRGMSQRGAIRIESALSLGQKEKIVMVNVEGKRLLLGVTTHNISVLENMLNEQDEVIPKPVDKPQISNKLGANQDFASHLKNMLGWNANNA